MDDLKKNHDHKSDNLKKDTVFVDNSRSFSDFPEFTNAQKLKDDQKLKDAQGGNGGMDVESAELIKF